MPPRTPNVADGPSFFTLSLGMFQVSRANYSHSSVVLFFEMF